MNMCRKGESTFLDKSEAVLEKADFHCYVHFQMLVGLDVGKSAESSFIQTEACKNDHQLHCIGGKKFRVLAV